MVPEWIGEKNPQGLLVMQSYGTGPCVMEPCAVFVLVKVLSSRALYRSKGVDPRLRETESLKVFWTPDMIQSPAAGMVN